ncbi:MAG: dTDP-4-dehydrorhamnose reductase [Bacteroidales bacterium]
MDILVTGSNGQLGSTLQEMAAEWQQHRFLFASRDDLDITSEKDVKQFFKDQKVDCLINCAGYTAVDAAEGDAATAGLVNAKGAGILADAAASHNALMIHISTDYVFDGTSCRPYTESDSANPKSVYGKSKLNGELEVIFNAKSSVIIRTSWLYSTHGHNFLKAIRNKAQTEKSLQVVYDQVGTPTYAVDLAGAIMHIIPKLPSKCRGEIYNYSNEGVASWFDVAKEIVDFDGVECPVTPVMTKERPPVAQRPHFSVLNKTRIKKDFGLSIPHWRDSLRACLRKMT